MKKSLTILAICCCLTISACQTTAKISQNSTLSNAPPIQAPPQRFNDEFIPAPSETSPQTPSIPPSEEHIPTPLPLRWDVSDVDTSYVSRERKLISFTFDDAPSHQLENILAVFSQYNEENPDCKATSTLFCNGYFFDAHTTHTLTAALTLGWELGNHSFSHPDLTTLNEEELSNEILKTDTLLSKLDGKPVHLFRPPYGKFNDSVRAVCPAPIVNWTIDTLDWSGTTVEEIVEQVLSQKADGAIVLMHDNCPNTVDALKILLPKLKEEGYQAVSVSTLAKMHQRTLKPGSVYIRVRKTTNE